MIRTRKTVVQLFAMPILSPPFSEHLLESTFGLFGITWECSVKPLGKCLIRDTHPYNSQSAAENFWCRNRPAEKSRIPLYYDKLPSLIRYNIAKM